MDGNKGKITLLDAFGIGEAGKDIRRGRFNKVNKLTAKELDGNLVPVIRHYLFVIAVN